MRPLTLILKEDGKSIQKNVENIVGFVCFEKVDFPVFD